MASAGIGRPPTTAENIADGDWLAVLRVKLAGVSFCDRAFGPRMLAAGRGSVVNMGSMSGVVVSRPQGQANSIASKPEVHHLTKSLVAERAWRGVRVDAVAPTYVETPLMAVAARRGAVVRRIAGRRLAPASPDPDQHLAQAPVVPEAVGDEALDRRPGGRRRSENIWTLTVPCEPWGRRWQG